MLFSMRKRLRFITDSMPFADHIAPHKVLIRHVGTTHFFRNALIIPAVSMHYNADYP